MIAFGVFMQKFGLFDLIEKLIPLEKANNNVSNNTPNATDTPIKNTKNSQENPPKTSNLAPYLSYIKRHNEISKRIDKQK